MDVFLHNIYNWYTKNRRNLPWRETTDPYKIWLSEIILQQTRVDQGISYYERFTERFPAISDLANASEDEVLKLWQGLGYYSRARNLHQTAKNVVQNFHGRFPETYREMLSLKGIGPYTAAAIASIAFDLPHPALDGNIYRVLARYFGIFDSPATGKGKKVFEHLARELMPEKNAGFHNQALMEFGALQCVPKSPDCVNCPVPESCFAASHQKVADLPVKAKKTKQRNRFFYYYYIESEKNTWLEKRTGDDIWKNLYQFPLLESENELNEKEILGKIPTFLNGTRFNIKSISDIVKHQLSHQIIFGRLVHAEVDEDLNLKNGFIPVQHQKIHDFAIPRLVERLMEDAGLF